MLQHAAAEGVGDGQVACAHRLHHARGAEDAVLAQLQRVAEAVVDAAQHGVDALQPAQGAQPEGAVAHRQVRPCTRE
jgi:hypothetical protein